ncbi:FIST N-terminal domain-containing protein [Amaricoccus solimangrovi]|uniref:GfdT protein n=1 Tax=Amaricoccus solimangrovi TaxID=2589815 RepID=A0A501WRR3_9RHOB|nr:FIST N-terminal domain-containing protein [Amaricoccus solimangrovi]TPE52149.1 GfdT protein [Amaricoccus solimangrovi]
MGELLGLAEDRSNEASGRVRRAQSLRGDDFAAVAEVRRALGPGPFALVILLVSSNRSTDAISAAVMREFPGQVVIGATTAGEIGVTGYLDGAIVAVALPAANFRAQTLMIPDLEQFPRHVSIQEVLRLRNGLAGSVPTWPNEFAFLLSDGLSLREEQFVSALGPALGGAPLFGGSAADGVNFERTFVLADGAFRSNTAVLAFIRTNCRVKVFRFDHLLPTEQRMVVTAADPARRLVMEINAEPAARAYARALGRDPDQLSPFIFAAHPVVVRIGGTHHVCAIQQVEPNGDLKLFSAVDQGQVLTLAEGQEIAAHLERSLDALSPDGPPEAIIACECILRRLEIEETQVKGVMSRTLARHNVVGFNTYGEQLNMLHVNQTFTGVAIYPPLGEDR